MLTSLVLSLAVEAPVTIPRDVGPAVHAAFLALLAERDAELAAALHDADGPRPFTCSTLVGGQATGRTQRLAPERALFIRVTGLEDAISDRLQALAAAPPPALQILEAQLAVTGATLDPAVHPWAGEAGYETLAAAHLLPGESAARQATLDFVSPTAFRSGGRVVPLPLPELVYGSLVDRWNAFAGVGLADEMRRFAAECVSVSRYRLATQAQRSRGGSTQIGFTGRCSFTAFSGDRYWLGVLQLLTDFAFYAGVGYQTTMGLGQARRAEGGV